MKRLLTVSTGLSALAVSSLAAAQLVTYEDYQAVFNLDLPGRPPFETVAIETEHVAGTFYSLRGEGGNIGVSIGEDGIIMIDDQFAPLTEKILSAIREISGAPIRFLINTHVHDDHVGGNANISSQGATIIAHENVRVRMIQGIRGNAPSPQQALPVLTFTDQIKLHLNGEDVWIVPSPPAHTDGDSFVYFTGSDVLHMGDVFRTTGYPNIDVGNGGTLEGTIAGLELGLAIAGPDTRIVPGHGVVSSRAEVQELLDLTLEVRDRIAPLVEQGLSFEEIVELQPTTDLDSRWGRRLDRFLPAVFLHLIEN